MTRGARFQSSGDRVYGRETRGARFGGAHLVGASVLQTPGGIQSEMAKIDHEIESFGSEIEGQVHARGGQTYTSADALAMIQRAARGEAPRPISASQDPIARFYNDAWIPFISGWRSWYHHNDGWLHNFFWNEAPNAESYQHKLTDLQDSARKIGMAVHSPAPDIESRSIADPHRASPVDYASDALATVGKVAKYALYGGLALGGMFAVAKIAETAKSK